MIDAFFRAIERSGFGHRRSRRWLLKWGATLGGLTAISNRVGLPIRAAPAIQLWREHEQRWGRQLMFPIGVLWMAADADDTFERGSLPLLRKAGIPYEELSQRDLARRWPQINLEGVRWGVYEPESGFL